MSYSSRVYRQRNPHMHDEVKERSFFSSRQDMNKSKQNNTFFQAKLSVNQPGDSYEREADSVANAVVNKSSQTPIIQQKKISGIQRLSTSMEDEKLGTNDARMERDKEIQTKPDKGAPAASPGISSQIENSSGKGNSLPPKTLHEMNSSFGVNFSKVHVHNDNEAVNMNKELRAQAFTRGSDIYFNRGKYNPENSEGKFLLAHELTHVIQQQSGQVMPEVQCKGGPFDLEPDVCISTPTFGTVCGSDAASLCSKKDLPGCSAVCKVFNCNKPNEPKTICPPGWRAAGSKGFEGQCCFGSETDSERNCCPPERIGFLDSRCCGPEEVVSENHCKKRSELPPLPPNLLCPFPGKRSLLGDCCFPPQVPKGLGCGLPDIKPPKPQPVVPQPIEIFFKLDRPFPGETSSSVGSVTTTIGKDNFNALVSALKQDSSLKVQLVGRASPEGGVAYNLELGARRARLIAAALKDAGVPESQIADPPVPDLSSDCQAIKPGVVTCGKTGSTGERDRQVLSRVFHE